jgi:hypothetical protein
MMPTNGGEPGPSGASATPNHPATMTTLLTEQETATLLKISKKSVQGWRYRGALTLRDRRHGGLRQTGDDAGLLNPPSAGLDPRPPRSRRGAAALRVRLEWRPKTDGPSRPACRCYFRRSMNKPMINIGDVMQTAVPRCSPCAVVSTRGLNPVDHRLILLDSHAQCVQSDFSEV